MREIKFRMYQKLVKRMMPWEKAKHLYKLDVLEDNEETDMFSSWMQYTGLKDKNGNEIYEGDILKFSGNVVALGIVKYNENFATFQACNGNSGWLFGNESGTNIEILGNIYENPELLEESK